MVSIGDKNNDGLVVVVVVCTRSVKGYLETTLCLLTYNVEPPLVKRSSERRESAEKPVRHEGYKDLEIISGLDPLNKRNRGIGSHSMIGNIHTVTI